MSEIEKHTSIPTDSSVTARPATEPDTGKPSANGNGNANGDKEDDIRGRPGVAAIKPEYLIAKKDVPFEGLDNDDADDAAERHSADTDGRSSKRQRLDTDSRSSNREKDKKKNRGQNKNRPAPITREPGPRLCRLWELGNCERETCDFQHSWAGYFEEKPKDILWPVEYTPEPPFVVYPTSQPLDGALGGTVDFATKCPVLSDLGYCPFGWRCRFAGAHVEKVQAEGEANGQAAGADAKQAGEWRISCHLKEQDVKDGWKLKETNWPDGSLLTKLRSDKYDFPFARRYLTAVEPDKPYTLSRKFRPPPASKPAAPAAGDMDEEAVLNAMSAEEAAANDNSNTKGVVAGESEAMDVPLRPEEKKRLDWGEGLYLAPLTTVGNLPFRRLCTTLGATITCSEMALAQPLISGQSDEWALCRRHSSEKTFGIQLAGGYPNRMVPAAEVIAKELGGNDGSGRGVDFVDVNLGCPIDLVFNQGAGSALMDTPGRLGKILVGMNRALGDIPLTVKFRTGVANNKPNAHKLIPRFATEWGASSLTLHGRSRQQRYSKLANWDYIKQCVDTLHAATDDAGLPRVPMFGNGDCYSAQQYWEEKEASGVDGVLLARGALIKPWLFTEIKERREWDISASERLDIVKQFAEFGLSHWGSDHQGVSTTRRFLCEYLSFTHRYIPIGLLERMPPQMNERPPPFKGRSELETLLASGDSRDWVKISEMFLGKVPQEGWGWVPKHKSNAYGGEEAQG